MTHIAERPVGITDDWLNREGLATKPLGDYRNDPELLKLVTTIFSMQGGFAGFGTLLGLVRDGKLIEGDTDIDFCVTVEHVPGMVNGLARCSDVVDIVRRNETYVTAMTKTSHRFIDFYLTHMDAGHRFIYCPQRGGHWDAGGVVMNWNMAMIDGEFRYWIPNNAEHLLQCHYGPNWRTPTARAEFFK